MASDMPKFFGLVSDESETVVQWFTDRREAEATLRAVLVDEPEWIDVVRIAEFDRMRPGIVRSVSLN